MSALCPTALGSSDEDELEVANRLIGIDESQQQRADGDVFAAVAVQCSLDTEEHLLEALIEADLRPFQYKSSTIVHSGPMNHEERLEAVDELLTAMQYMNIGWSGVIAETERRDDTMAASAIRAAKNILTSGPSEPALVLHDGEYEGNGYSEMVLRQAAGAFDESFREYVCPVDLTFQPGGDQIHPQIIAADYIAGRLSHALSQGACFPYELDGVINYDNSWNDPADEPFPIDIPPSSTRERDDAVERAETWLHGRGAGANLDTEADTDWYIDNLELRRTESYLEELLQ